MFEGGWVGSWCVGGGFKGRRVGAEEGRDGRRERVGCVSGGRGVFFGGGICAG